jgi:hypothetical protein
MGTLLSLPLKKTVLFRNILNLPYLVKINSLRYNPAKYDIESSRLHSPEQRSGIHNQARSTHDGVQTQQDITPSMFYAGTVKNCPFFQGLAAYIFVLQILLAPIFLP